MPVFATWIDRVERRLARWCKQGLGRTWVVAVSGGGDSVGLLRVMHGLAGSLGLRLSVAHLNHGVRGESAGADAAFVAALAASLDLPFVLGAWKPIRAGHFESDARRARYDWLTEVASVRGASVIAVGHTLDDQAETILHRILRGTGPRGLAGIPRRRLLSSTPRLTLARPLLGVSRQEVRGYLAALGQPFREDPSNCDLSRTRARIRHDLLPGLAAEYNPHVAGALVRLGSLVSRLEHVLEAEMRKLERSAVVSRADDCVVLEHDFVRSIPTFQRAEVLRRVWRGAGWPEGSMSARRWRRLAVLVEKDEMNRVDVGAHVEVSTERAFLVLRRCARSSSTTNADSLEPISLAVPGLTVVPWAGAAIDVRIDPGPEVVRGEIIDLERVTLPLVVRPAAAGDRFEPLGMAGQTMALADFFRGRHIRRADRARIPLVCDRDGIIWVVGHRISDRVKMSETTARSLGLRSCNPQWDGDE